jgi:hypothetical protein
MNRPEYAEIGRAAVCDTFLPPAMILSCADAPKYEEKQSQRSLHRSRCSPLAPMIAAAIAFVQNLDDETRLGKQARLMKCYRSAHHSESGRINSSRSLNTPANEGGFPREPCALYWREFFFAFVVGDRLPDALRRLIILNPNNSLRVGLSGHVSPYGRTWDGKPNGGNESF